MNNLLVEFYQLNDIDFLPTRELKINRQSSEKQPELLMKNRYTM